MNLAQKSILLGYNLNKEKLGNVSIKQFRINYSLILFRLDRNNFEGAGGYLFE
jgi:hypothetical protein